MILMITILLERMMSYETINESYAYIICDSNFNSTLAFAERNGPQLLGSGKSEISRRFQAARSRVAYSKYTASGVCPSSAL